MAMKIVTALGVLVTMVVAEPPPSHSYLPPPSSNRGGYQSGPQASHLPQVIAARNLGPQDQSQFGPRHGAGANGFSRNSGHSPAARFGGHQPQGYNNQAGTGYDNGAGAALARNALEEANGEPAHYNFGYMVNDYQEGTDFGHHEAREDERAEGEYHVVLPDGRKQTVSYEADERGFKPQISYQETEDLSRGYDANAGNFRAGVLGSGQHGGHGSHSNGQHGDHGSHGNARSNSY